VDRERSRRSARQPVASARLVEERPTGAPPPEVVRRHVELIKRGAAAITEADVDTLLSLVSQDFELHPGIAGAFVGATIYRGKQGARRYLLDITEVFEQFKFRPLGFSAWRDYLICPSKVTGNGRASGVEIDFVMTAIWRFEADHVVWGGTYFSLNEGLEAIGASADELEGVD
jgi:ketosteroid isomerase-like protein